MPRLKEIWCPQTEIETLEGLRQLPSLEKLNCCATQLNSLEGLKNFPSLSELICFSTPLRGLDGLENLPRLKVLDCSGTRVSDLAPLRGLPLLTVLSCSDTEISDLGPLRGLPCLTKLNCSSTRISDLEPLRGLPRLRKLDCCSTNIRSLGPLADVPVLARLSCSGAAIADLAPLANHPGLEELLCSHNDIDSLAPLKGLPRLSTLDAGATKLTTLSELEDLPLLSRLSFSNTEIDDLRPLAALQNLSYVNCYSARVTSFEGLEGLSRLVTLNCDKTPLTSLEGLENAHALERLVCSETKISSFDPLLPLPRLRILVAEHCGVVSVSPELWLKPSLKQVELYGTNLKGVPDEVLAEENCIYELAAHCADLGENPERLSDVKLMVLGNGRVGKTQLVRRLQGKPYQSDSVSTHGIMVQPTPLPIGEGGEIVPVKIWDFGGQDMYHATHALFYRTRATFLVCWHPRFENEETVNDEGFLSRNHKLTYWLQNIRQFGGRNSAILVAQTQCDSACEAEQETAKIASRLEYHSGYKKLDLATSAATGQGIEALIAALKMAYSSINPPLIGPGRAKVKRLLEERLARIDEAREVHGEELPEPVQALRTLTVDEFKDLCDDAGQISDPDMFLKFLHDAGVVFWREGSLQDRIIVDQNWALEAIYALFNRDHCVAHLRAAGGRFTAADVGRWLWDKDFSRRDQHLFLAMMETCGICFEAPDRSYFAPEFLPEEPSREVQKNWPTALGFGTVVQIFAPRERKIVFRSPVESRTLIHAVICSLGRLYGETGAFWATGLQVRDDELECVGMIAQSTLPADVRRQSDGESAITIRVRPLRHANDENLELFLKRLCDAIANRAEQLGLEIRRSQ
ncbi:hypothetical protein FMN50_19470 [Rhodobacterales bacterium]|nr:hypothetical protein FMN50_19470 [Rhodobacterales bacterium]